MASIPEAGEEPTQGSTATSREIAQQPMTWRRSAQLITGERAGLDIFLDPLLSRSNLRIVITGAGTSAFAGAIAAPTLARLLNRRVDSVATTDLVSNPREYFAEDVPTLLVSLARSGNSPESTAATELADQVLTDVSHLILTCNREGKLFRDHSDRAASKVVLMPPETNDAGFAMTSSFTSMLISCLLIFTGPQERTVESLATAAERLLETQQQAADELAAVGFERVVYLGSGPLAGLARESALKLLELTAGKVVAYHDSSLGFRHGPKAILNDKTLVLVYVSADPYTRRYDLDILAELRSALPEGNVISISTSRIDSDPGSGWILPELSGLDDAFLAPVYVLAAQLLGLAFSLHLGLSPDNPFPGGGVNRVVKGVQIHSLPTSQAV